MTNKTASHLNATVGEINIICSDLLLVDDLPAAVRHLTAHNVEFVSEWQANEKRVFIRDPDGLVFEIIQKE